MKPRALRRSNNSNHQIRLGIQCPLHAMPELVEQDPDAFAFL